MRRRPSLKCSCISSSSRLSDSARGRLQLGVEALGDAPLDDEHPVEGGEARIVDVLTHGATECREV